MNCQDARNKIDRLVFESTPLIEGKLKEHINHCKKCNDYYTDCLNKTKLLKSLRNSEPIINDPTDLTNNIMSGINEETGKAKQSQLFVWIPRLLSAACLALLLTFGYEQFVVIEKMKSLEKQLIVKEENTSQTIGFYIIETYKMNFIKSFSNEEMTPLLIVKKWRALRDEKAGKEMENRTFNENSIFLKRIIANRSKSLMNHFQN